MKPPCIKPFLRHAETTAFVPSILFNALLLVLIWVCTEEEMRPYSRILFYNCVVDLIFATFTYLVDMVSKVDQSSYNANFHNDSGVTAFIRSRTWIATRTG